MKKTIFTAICLSLIPALCITGRTLALPGAIYAWDLQPASPPGNDFTKISAGTRYIALRSDGTIVEWNANGNIYEPSLPVETRFIDIVAGNDYYIAIDTNGALVDWGMHADPNDPPPAGSYSAVTCADTDGAALTASGAIVTWPVNYAPTGNNFTAISGGRNHILALRDDGSLLTFDNIGVDNDMPAGNDYVAIAAGGYHNLALKADGSLVAWVYNGFGLSDVPAGNNFVAITAGEDHSSALRDDGTIVTWGGTTDTQTTTDTCTGFATSLFSGFLSDSTLALVELPGVRSINVFTPNGGETFPAGSPQTITWQSNLPFGHADLWLLKNGLHNKFIGQAPVTDGSFTWNIPTPIDADSDYTIGLNWINSCGLAYADTSNAPFTITCNETIPTIAVTSPNGGEVWAKDSVQTITWTTNNNSGTVELWTYPGDGTHYNFLGAVPAAIGHFDWPIPPSADYNDLYAPPGQTKILARWTNGNYFCQDMSDDLFEITPGITQPSQLAQLAVTRPIGGENWSTGTTDTITWDSNFTNGLIDIELQLNGNPYCYLGQAPVSDGSFEWHICHGCSTSGNYTIVLKESKTSLESESGVFGISQSYSPNLSIATPGTPWVTGSPVTITWDNDGLTGDLHIFLPDYINNHWGHVAVPVTDESYTWTVPPSLEAGTRNVSFYHYQCGQVFDDSFPVEIVKQPALLGDFDADGDVDLRDLAQLQACFTGPETRLQEVPCNYFDFSADADIDINDFIEIHNQLTGP